MDRIIFGYKLDNSNYNIFTGIYIHLYPLRTLRPSLVLMAGNVRGSGKDGEHLEASMPENVKTSFSCPVAILPALKMRGFFQKECPNAKPRKG
jgi:hypothetical protein